MEGGGLSAEARRMLGPAGVREVARVFAGKDLLIEAGALAFRGFLTLIPALLFAVGLLGFFGLEDVWRQDIAPELKSSVDPAAFEFINRAVIKVLTSQDVFWVTVGAAFAVWEASAVVRAAGKVMNRIYGVEDDSSFIRELAESIPAGAAVGFLALAAIAASRLVPLGVEALLGTGAFAGIAAFVASWTVVAALLVALVAVVVRFAPAIERPPRWLSFGAGVIVGAWALMSILFALYLRTFANYGSVFGSLATIFVLVEYLFLLSVIFLGGIVIDAILDGRDRHD